MLVSMSVSLFNYRKSRGVSERDVQMGVGLQDSVSGDILY